MVFRHHPRFNDGAVCTLQKAPCQLSVSLAVRPCSATIASQRAASDERADCLDDRRVSMTMYCGDALGLEEAALTPAPILA